MKRTVTFCILALLTLSIMADNADAKLKKMEQEARSIISQMTVKEKISQLMNDAAGIPRLGIKPYNWWNEALHGVARDGKATVFPQAIGMSATFDEDLIHRIGENISAEARAKYNVAQDIENYSLYAGLTFWSPNVNIFRDPRWGRGMETWGEDPFLTGTLGTSFVRGMQGDDPVYLRTAACAKHFAVHSGPEGTRHSANVHPSKRDLNETFLPAFKMLVQKGKVEAIMSAYNRLYDASCTGSKFLLTDVLRKEWGFNGHIVSDCGAVYDIHHGHKIAKTGAEAAAISIKAGLNLECGNTFQHIQEALDQKLLSEKDLDGALLPLMMTRLKLGILHPDSECPYNRFDENVICCAEHKATALEAAQKSMVLLKNNNVLPLKKDTRKIHIAGPAATDVYFLMGNYYGLSNDYSTYLQGIVSKASNGTGVYYVMGFNSSHQNRTGGHWSATDAVLNYDVAIAFLGLSGNLEGEQGDAIESNDEGDRKSLSIPEPQMTYFRAMAEAKKKNPKNKLIAVITGGSPLDLKEITAAADAVILAWYAGQEGGNALGDLLFGDASFSGRLPITFPDDITKLPPLDDYSMKGRTYKYMQDNIQFPFGYGLTYGKVVYSDAVVKKTKQGVTVTATLNNESDRACDEVAQAYLSTPTAGVSSPISSLVGFKRVHLDAGSKAKVEFTIEKESLKTVQEDGTSKLLKGDYTFHVGGAAPSAKTRELGISITSVSMKE